MYDLVVLGGGSGGLNVAVAAARVGARVALVEKNRLGGECTYSACVPSKALLRAARLAHDIRRAGAFGIRVPQVEVDFAAVMDRVRSVVTSIANSHKADGLRAQGIDVYFGSPTFLAYDTLQLDGQSRLLARRFVIATGSRPAIPPIPGLAAAGYLDNTSVWNLRSRPETLLVIGAGPAGLEFAQAFSRLGSRVTVLTHDKQILPREDPEVSERVQAILAAEGIAFYNGIEITSIEVRDGKKVCLFRSQADGSTFEAARDEILVCTGRLANVDGLNLDVLGVHADPRSGIEVDDTLQTHCRQVWAIGDVLGRYQFTHAAEREAAVVFQNALLRLGKKMDYSALPWATFVDPEVASVGKLTGPGPDEEPYELRLFRVDTPEVDRALIDGDACFAKVAATPSGRIVGATIVGPEASAVLQELVVAMENGLTLTDLMNTVHTYPSYATLVRRLALQYGATRLEKGYVQTALRWLYGFDPRHKAGSEPDGAGQEAGRAEAARQGH
jgi:pyruvate/2-oxoglutarate dehydrogenase complex dihydrolipoamide dehydrogenase (E3) component